MVEMILIGCGMMGLRHIRGYAELERVRPGSLHLKAVCDLRLEAAQGAADEAERLLGYRPAVYRSAEEALSVEKGIEAADVVTPPRSHPQVVIPLLKAGLDILVEKPLAVRVEDGREMVETAKSHRRILAVAENNRRDPMNRLMRHIIQTGFIGRPHFVIQMSVSAVGRRVLASPWRHSKEEGGLALDIGIHQAYILEMLMGPIDTIHAVSRQVWSRRLWHRPDGSVEEIDVESEDLFAATLTFESGAMGSWVMHFGSPGAGRWERVIFGELGTAEGPPDRSGRPVRVQRGREVLEGDKLVEALPDFHLNEIESSLFGERPGGYSFESTVTDRKLIAAEVWDFIEALRCRREPEVNGKLGLRSVAIISALTRSALSGEPISVK